MSAKSLYNLRHYVFVPIFDKNYYSMLILFNSDDLSTDIRFESTHNFTYRLPKSDMVNLGFYHLELPGLSFGAIEHYLSHMSVNLQNQVQSANVSANSLNSSVSQAKRMLHLIEYYRFVLNKSYVTLENWHVARGTVNHRIDLNSLLFLDRQTSKTLRLNTAENILRDFLDLSYSIYGEHKKISLENYNKLFLCYTTNCIIRIDGNGGVKTLDLNSLDKLEKFIEMYPHNNVLPEGLSVRQNFSSMSWEEFCVRQAFPDSLVNQMKEKIKLVIEKRLFPDDQFKLKRSKFTELRNIKTVGIKATAYKGIESYPFFAKHWKFHGKGPIMIYITNIIPAIDLSFDSKTNNLLTEEQIKPLRKRIK